MSTPPHGPSDPYDPYSAPAPPSGAEPPPHQDPAGQQPPSYQQPPAASPYSTAGPAPGSAPSGPAGPPSPYETPSPYGTPGTYQTPPPVDGVSIAALVTGILTLGLIPLGLGIAGIVRTKGGRRRGRGMAIAGVVLGALSTIWWGLVTLGILLFATNAEFQEGFLEGFDASFNESFQEQTGTDLAVGECFEPPADLAEGGVLEQVDCAGPHTAEVIGVHELTGDEFPGLDAVYADADPLCMDSFESYLGIDYADSAFDFIYFHPTGASWTFGDRLVLCGAITMDGSPLEAGSLQGIQQ